MSIKYRGFCQWGFGPWLMSWGLMSYIRFYSSLPEKIKRNVKLTLGEKWKHRCKSTSFRNMSDNVWQSYSCSGGGGYFWNNTMCTIYVHVYCVVVSCNLCTKWTSSRVTHSLTQPCNWHLQPSHFCQTTPSTAYPRLIRRTSTQPSQPKTVPTNTN